MLLLLLLVLIIIKILLLALLANTNILQIYFQDRIRIPQTDVETRPQSINNTKILASFAGTKKFSSSGDYRHQTGQKPDVDPVYDPASGSSGAPPRKDYRESVYSMTDAGPVYDLAANPVGNTWSIPDTGPVYDEACLYRQYSPAQDYEGSAEQIQSAHDVGRVYARGSCSEGPVPQEYRQSVEQARSVRDSGPVYALLECHKQ